MGRRRAPLPPELQGRAFRRSDARDVPYDRLRGTDLWAPARGLRLPADQTDERAVLRARALALPDGAAFSHATAARCHGIPLPLRVMTTTHITSPPGTRARRGKGIQGYQRHLPPEQIVTLYGVPCTRLVRTFCDLADVLTLAELVAAGDWIIGRGRTGMSRAGLQQEAGAIMTARQGRKVLRALDLLDRAAESPKESELRVLLIEAGFGPIECQGIVREPSGEFVARCDLVMRRLKIAIEYEGDHHRDKGQWRRDMQHRRRIEALGWIYIPVTQADLTDPTRLFADLRSAIRSRG